MQNGLNKHHPSPITFHIPLKTKIFLGGTPLFYFEKGIPASKVPRSESERQALVTVSGALARGAETEGALVVIKGKLTKGLYFLQGSTIIGEAAISSSTSDSDLTRLWHMRLGHMSGMTILSRLLGGQKTGKLSFCEHCVYGKHCRVKFSTAVHRTKGTVDYIHSDLCL